MTVRSHVRRSAVTLVTFVATLAAACGQKGPLYLPDHGATVVPRPASQSGAPPASTPAPDSAAPSPSPDTDADPTTQAKKRDKDGQSPAQAPSKP
ncbi:MAG TPA: lipoprotein [Steroidobacteraceae bacterium]|nr:lipoprotein [Steroidobacteraceae bacterium]